MGAVLVLTVGGIYAVERRFDPETQADRDEEARRSADDDGDKGAR